MSCCCPHSREASRFFSWFARRYRRRFERKGFEPSQKQLVEGLTRAGVSGSTLLEIGCGVGYLHQRLLESGAASATGIDLSPKVLQQAQESAEARGLANRVEYHTGDFVELAGSVAPADAVILDKVICCYPDARVLVERSMGKANKVYAFTIPRPRWFIRVLMEVGTMFLRLIRCGFRGYVHDPAKIDQWLTGAGFVRAYDNETFMWLTRIYRRLESR